MSMIGGVEGTIGGYRSVGEPGVRETAMDMGEEGWTVLEEEMGARHSLEGWSVSPQVEQGGGEALRFPLSFFLFFRR